jgi:hypothetical protein
VLGMLGKSWVSSSLVGTGGIFIGGPADMSTQSAIAEQDNVRDSACLGIVH